MENSKCSLGDLRLPILIFVVFWTIALLLWQTKHSLFFLFNFGYIGTAISVGIGLYIILPPRKKPSGRRFAQLMIGIYMLGFLGLFQSENMQIEGFFLLMLSGVFAGSVIHYLVAKVLGPVLFGRGFCGWACWTAMVLDYLPYRQSKKGRGAPKWETLRYIHFTLSLTVVLMLWFIYNYRPTFTDKSQLTWLIVGNSLYYVSAIFLAVILKDNRAFCKYLCPITVPLKITSRFSIMKIAGNDEECTQCGACSKSCPMDIDIMKYVQNAERVLSTECILCLTCTTACPKGILADTLFFDIGGKEYIRRVDDV